MKKNQSGSIGMNIILVLMLIALGGIIYFYYFGGKKSDSTATPVNKPEYIAPARPLAKTSDRNYKFDDGLKNPDSVRKYTLDEFGEGIAISEVFKIDINNDGNPDRIIRELYENGTDHFYYDYKIEMNLNGQFVNITPENFRTTEAADCALQKIKFIFHPDFKVIKIARDWEESWTTPTVANQTVYILKGDRLEINSMQKLSKICNVSDLF